MYNKINTFNFRNIDWFRLGYINRTNRIKNLVSFRM
jgi:hypothetical protein